MFGDGSAWVANSNFQEKCEFKVGHEKSTLGSDRIRREWLFGQTGRKRMIKWLPVECSNMDAVFISKTYSKKPFVRKGSACMNNRYRNQTHTRTSYVIFVECGKPIMCLLGIIDGCVRRMLRVFDYLHNFLKSVQELAIFGIRTPTQCHVQHFYCACIQLNMRVTRRRRYQ